MNRRIRRGLTALGVACAWFLTLVGGWSDVGVALGGELDAVSRQIGLDTDPVVRLTGSVLVSGDEFGLPTHISVAGDRLLVLDQFGRSAITELNRHSGATLRTYGSRGEGPGEFVTPVSLFAEGDSLVIVLDAGNNRVTWLRRSGMSFALARTVRLALESVALDFAPTGDGTLLVTGLLAEGRMASLDADGRLVRYLGEPPSAERLPPARRLEVLQGALRAYPSGRRHVFTSRFASRIEVFDPSSSEPFTIWGPERFEPRAGRDETRFGYLDSAPLESGVLALYSGRTREEYPGRANYGSIVHFFDAHGELRSIYHLDSDVISIASDEKGSRLYAVRHDPVPAIVVYDIH